MEENKFEKQVQQKMDELKIHPADSVWEKIEARIEKKKHSKRGLFLFIIIFYFPCRRIFVVEYPAPLNHRRLIIPGKIALKKIPVRFQQKLIKPFSQKLILILAQ